ncbi:2-dehydropantoate 2-reductase [Larkinella arboricola]|uniref:2-dehydropantoate 2-reductase n=1 Tax=Larkinella arboricola TaxID=643671 RepID=A0A327X5A6_LARAB|nr:2-dehydropantoate 2-reductase [Larkinella arboricola]RAK02085.1 2-dehydropantoate 2-reductase [Larkinella arboricola]
MKNTIYIIGAGAIGKVLAVALKRANKNVILLRGSVDDQASDTQKINVIVDQKTELEAEIEVSSLRNFPTLDGIIVLTSKSYGNQKLAQRLKNKAGHSPVVILQNGLGVEQPFIDNAFPEIYRCVLFVTSQPVSAHTVRFKPVSVSPIGVIQGNNTRLISLVDSLNTPLFPFRAETDIQPIIWKKTVINCIFNAICPLLEIDNGIFHRDESALEIARRVIGECTAVAREKAIFLDADDVLESLLLISRSSDGQLISTLQDMRNGRQTEMDTLNAEIVRIASSLHKEDLVPETRLLGELVNLKSALGRSNS